MIFIIFRIFVNRSLHLQKIRFFGFDMDYTLACKLSAISLYCLIKKHYFITADNCVCGGGWHWRGRGWRRRWEGLLFFIISQNESPEMTKMTINKMSNLSP